MEDIARAAKIHPKEVRKAKNLKAVEGYHQKFVDNKIAIESNKAFISTDDLKVEDFTKLFKTEEYRNKNAIIKQSDDTYLWIKRNNVEPIKLEVTSQGIKFNGKLNKKLEKDLNNVNALSLDELDDLITKVLVDKLAEKITLEDKHTRGLLDLFKAEEEKDIRRQLRLLLEASVQAQENSVQNTTKMAKLADALRTKIIDLKNAEETVAPKNLGETEDKKKVGLYKIAIEVVNKLEEYGKSTTSEV